MARTRLGRIAYARSGDKGSDVNVGVIAYTREGYKVLSAFLTAQEVVDFFEPIKPKEVIRYELPNLGALNFVLRGVLDGGGSRALRTDAQGKALGQAVLDLELEIPDDRLASLSKATIEGGGQ
jgi:hypothetical protein